MSEFTAGTLFLNDDFWAITEISQPFHDKCRVEKLNAKWGVILMRDDFLTDSNTIHQLLKISCRAPVIYFVNAEDHCWGYKVMQGEKIVASLNVSYESEHQMFLGIAERNYPNKDAYCLPVKDIQAIYESIEKSLEYTEKFSSQFNHTNVEVFDAFGIKSSELECIFRMEYMQNLESIHDLVDEFKSILNINEMSWVNYDTDFTTR